MGGSAGNYIVVSSGEKRFKAHIIFIKYFS
jgi:hypothetical protein